MLPGNVLVSKEDGCQRSHHSLLHPTPVPILNHSITEFQPRQLDSGGDTPMFDQETHVATRVNLSQLGSNHPLVQMPVAPVWVYSSCMNRYGDTYAVIDTDADHNICCSEL